MPTYAYACTACDHTFDVVQSFSDDPLSVCPQCEGRLRKVYGSIGVTFKGSGFYRTDSRSSAGSSSLAGSSSGASSGSDKSGSSDTASGGSAGSSGSTGSSTGASSSSPTPAASTTP